MLAIFHHHQPDDTIVATCPTHPNWVHVYQATRASKAVAETALLEHIQQTTAFAHYEIPVEPVNVRQAA